MVYRVLRTQYKYTDDWDSFNNAFSADNHIIGKTNTVGIEGNTCTVYEVRGNCRLRHRIRRAFTSYFVRSTSRRTCCFSKKMLNHLKAFALAFFYTCAAQSASINYGYV